MILVREATHDDIIHFIRMGREFAAFADEPFDRESAAQHMEWILGEESAAAFIAFNDKGEAIGICSGIYAPTFWDQSKLMATEMWWWVNPENRGSRAGLMLMDALESWARAAGAWRLEMMTLVDIGPGVGKIYERRGYRERERGYVKEL